MDGEMILFIYLIGFLIAYLLFSENNKIQVAVLDDDTDCEVNNTKIKFGRVTAATLWPAIILAVPFGFIKKSK